MFLDSFFGGTSEIFLPRIAYGNLTTKTTSLFFLMLNFVFSLTSKSPTYTLSVSPSLKIGRKKREYGSKSLFPVEKAAIEVLSDASLVDRKFNSCKILQDSCKKVQFLQDSWMQWHSYKILARFLQETVLYHKKENLARFLQE